MYTYSTIYSEKPINPTERHMYALRLQKCCQLFFFILYIDVQTQKYNLKGKYEKIDVIIMTQDWQP